VKYGLRPIRFHDLRHSCATIMLYLGYTMKDIQTWLGHSNYNFTANVYVHSSRDSHVQMAQTFSERLPALTHPSDFTEADCIPAVTTTVMDI
jgi:integrase